MLASRAGRASSDYGLSTSPLLLEEVCFCTLRMKNATHTARKNGMNQTNATENEIDLEVQAPTSIDMLRLINRKLEESQSLGLLTHVDALLQLTEPDYAYYASEMEARTPINQAEGTLMPSSPFPETSIPMTTVPINTTYSPDELAGKVDTSPEPATVLSSVAEQPASSAGATNYVLAFSLWGMISVMLQ